MKIYSVLLAALGGLCSVSSQTAPLCHDGETSLYAFTTTSGKIVSVCRGPHDSYLVYRYGTAQKTELQYPAVLDASSWRKFTYAWYMRPSMGGTNEGLDINHLSFVNAGVRYTIYSDTGDHDAPKTGIGVAVGSQKEVFSKARRNSNTGTLIDLRDNKKINISDSPF